MFAIPYSRALRRVRLQATQRDLNVRPKQAAHARQLADDRNTEHALAIQKNENHSAEDAGGRRLGWLCQSMPGISRMVASVSPISSTARRGHK